MRNLSRLAGGAHSTPHSSSYFSAAGAAYSTFSGGGRGRGRGSAPPFPRVPGQPHPSSPSPAAAADDDRDSFHSSDSGHGRGGGSQRSLPSSPPSLSNFVSSLISTGRGRGRAASPLSPEINQTSKQPVFFRREDNSQFADAEEEIAPLPRNLAPPNLSGSGRGKVISSTPDSAPKQAEVNRHLRARPPIGARQPSAQAKINVEEAVRKAKEALSRGGQAAPRGRGGRSRGGGTGRGRGRSISRRGRDAPEEFELHVGDNADGERLQKRLGEANMSKLEQGFQELGWTVLPSPAEEAYLDALHTNNLIEYEPEYLMEFDTNPDIDEKPPMSLEEYLAKIKPFLMAYEGIQSQEEWEEIIKDLYERLPHMKELMDMYCGPNRVTAKVQNEELERVAKTLPESAPSSVKRFTDKCLLTLQSNPGWGFHRKCQFMDKLVWEVSQQYK